MQVYGMAPCSWGRGLGRMALPDEFPLLPYLPYPVGRNVMRVPILIHQTKETRIITIPCYVTQVHVQDLTFHSVPIADDIMFSGESLVPSDAREQLMYCDHAITFKGIDTVLVCSGREPLVACSDRKSKLTLSNSHMVFELCFPTQTDFKRGMRPPLCGGLAFDSNRRLGLCLAIGASWLDRDHQRPLITFLGQIVASHLAHWLKICEIK